MGYGKTILLQIPMSISLQLTLEMQIWIVFSLPVQQLMEILLNSVYWFQNLSLSQLICLEWLDRWFTLVLGQQEFLNVAMSIYKMKLFFCYWGYRHRFLFLIVSLEDIVPFIFYFLWRVAAVHKMSLYDVGCLAFFFLWESFKILLLAVKAS